MAQPILIVLGPSGSGKTTLAGWLEKEHHYLWLEIDRMGALDGIDQAGLRSEWDAFIGRNDPSELAASLHRRCSRACRGVVLSFQSKVLPSPTMLQAAERNGISSIILYGSLAECRQAFLEREQHLMRGLDERHWMKHNEKAHGMFSHPAYQPYRLAMFESGRFRSRQAILSDLNSRIRPAQA